MQTTNVLPVAHQNPLDRNHDGRVNLADLSANSNTNAGLGMNNGLGLNSGLGMAHQNPLDRNHDGRVNLADLSANSGLVGQTAGTRTSFRNEPILHETIQKEVVVHERIHPVQKEEIQPIIYREREQLDVKQVTQMMHETQIQPTLYEKRELAADVRAPIVERGAPIAENIHIGTTTRDATVRSQQIHAPIVEETVRKTIIEEIQPVLERDVFVPTVVQNTQPIYEKIVEAPNVYREVREVRELGTREAAYVAPAYVAPVVAAPIVREVPVVVAPVVAAPIIQHVTMSTTTTTTDSFVPAKIIREGELRNFQPAAATTIAPTGSRRV